MSKPKKTQDGLIHSATITIGIDKELEACSLIKQIIDNLIRVKFSFKPEAGKWFDIIKEPFDLESVDTDAIQDNTLFSHCDLAMLSDRWVNLLSKDCPTILFFHHALKTSFIKAVALKNLTPLGFFQVEKFEEGKEEFSELARLEKVIKSFFRAKAEEVYREEKLQKPLNWKVEINTPEHPQVSLLSDSAMREMMTRTQRMIHRLEATGQEMIKFRKSIAKELEQLHRLEDTFGSADTASIETAKGLYRKIQKENPTKMAGRIPTILIEGETGTGKTLVAQVIADGLGMKKEDGSFSKVNLVNMSEDLVDSALFGVVPGQFTDASFRLGKILSCAGGMLFLDEIGEIPLSIQAKLLTYMDDYILNISGMSGTGPRVPVIIIAATNRDLEAEVQRKAFRADLYHRFHYRLKIPPLSDRKDDFRFLVSFALQNCRNKEDAQIESISIKAIEKLEGLNYPGNFRQLESILSHAMANAELKNRKIILAEDIP